MRRLLQSAVALAAALLGAPPAVFSAEPVEWTFDMASEVVGMANLEDGRVANGALAGTTAWDPHFSLCCPKDGFDAAQLTWLAVRMYSSADADLLDVYYGSPDGLWCLGGKLPVRKGWATYSLDLSKNNWRETTAGDAAKRWGGASGRVSALRLDPGNQAGRWIVVDRVRLEPAQPGQVEGVVAEPRGRASLRTLRAPKAVEEGGRLEVSATFDVTVPEGLSNGTAFLWLRHGEAVLRAVEKPVTFAGPTLTVAEEFPVSRYWNSGALTVEAGCYELDGAAATARVAFANSRIGRVKPPACELRRVGGDAAIFVNGKPMPGFLFLNGRPPNLACHREAAQAGVHLYSDWFGTSRHADMGHVAPGTYDYGEYDRYFAAILEADPDAWFLPHIGLSGPLWWQRAHPEEMSLREDGAREPTSFASELWKREMGEDLRKLLARLRQAPYADRIIGYIVYSGYTAEWQMWGTWQPSRDDYSAPAQRAFRAFLQRRYGTDEKLRAAWADGAVTLASAEMPRWDKRRPGGPQVLRDPKAERQAVDFYEFISTMTSDAILHFSHIAREATEGQSLIGTYYAYLTAHGINQQDSGHVAAQRVFDSPDIDFLMSPPNYWYRKPGEACTFMSATDSLRMRGKLWLDESDHRTFLADPGAGFGRASTLEESIGVFRREFAEVLAKRAAVSWFDMSGGWFSHPALLAEMGRSAQVMQQSLASRQPFQPEVGVFVDPESYTWMRPTAANSALVLNQVVTMPQSGAPWDFCLLSDIDDARMPDYKLYVFLNAFRVDGARREAIQRKLRRNHATALFIYAPGYFDREGASLENMRALTGIRIAKDEGEGAPQVIFDPASELGRGFPAGEPAGAKKLTVSPLFYADDAGAQVVGRLVGSGRPGLVVKPMDGWTSVYSAAMTLPPALMRRLARQAGVHVWLETDDALYTDGQYLGVHAAANGTKRVLLPFDGRAVDALTGKALPCQGRTVTLEMKQAETVLMELRPQRESGCVQGQPAKQQVPVIEGYVHVYEPQGAVFPGPDTQDLKSGTFYPSWQPNDHCFVKGPDSRWHAFGITHPESQPGQRRHQGEYVLFHAVSSGETFAGSLAPRSWADQPNVLAPAQRPGENINCHAPTVVKEGGLYKMIYGPCPFRLAVSEDLNTWTPKGPVGVHEKSGRDPSLFVWEGTYYLVYCAGNSVKAATSKNLAEWSEPVEIYRGEVATYQCESPTLVRHGGAFYLFWCLWDTANKAGNGYDERSFACCSDSPLDFRGRPAVAELKAHAPEIFQDEKGDWFISSVQYPARGVSVSRLTWK